MDDDRPLPLELPAAALSWLQAVMTALRARASDPRAKKAGKPPDLAVRRYDLECPKRGKPCRQVAVARITVHGR